MKSSAPAMRKTYISYFVSLLSRPETRELHQIHMSGIILQITHRPEKALNKYYRSNTTTQLLDSLQNTTAYMMLFWSADGHPDQF